MIREGIDARFGADVKVRRRAAAEVLVAMLDIEVDLVRDLGAFGGLCALGAEERSNGYQQEPKRETTEYHFDEEGGGRGVARDGRASYPQSRLRV